jgi:1-aminocyclopropane-1-carboxylate deaminase/D-cysteine desulfhydrase-like pyridoxal-dependent ACC family enzyme
LPATLSVSCCSSSTTSCTIQCGCCCCCCCCCCCILQVTKEEYASLGAARLGAALTQQLQQQGLKPYYIPVGGSSALGCWGYLHAAQEIAEQEKEMGQSFDVLASVSLCSAGCCCRRAAAAVTQLLFSLALLGKRSCCHAGRSTEVQGCMQAQFYCRCPAVCNVCMQACGSSGTTAGLALGAKLAGLAAQVHAYGVCDSPEYFYAEIDGLLQQLGYTDTGTTE